MLSPGPDLCRLCEQGRSVCFVECNLTDNERRFDWGRTSAWPQSDGLRKLDSGCVIVKVNKDVVWCKSGKWVEGCTHAPPIRKSLLEFHFCRLFLEISLRTNRSYYGVPACYNCWGKFIIGEAIWSVFTAWLICTRSTWVFWINAYLGNWRRPENGSALSFPCCMWLRSSQFRILMNM